MTTTEDVLLPATVAALREAAVLWPQIPQSPRAPTVLFGAYRPVAGVEIVAVTGLSNTSITARREETIAFDIATWTNVPGLDEAATWDRRVQLTEAVLSVLFGEHRKSIIPDVARDAGVSSWSVTARQTSLEPAPDAIAGASGWLGFSLLTITAVARPC